MCHHLAEKAWSITGGIVKWELLTGNFPVFDLK